MSGRCHFAFLSRSVPQREENCVSGTVRDSVSEESNIQSYATVMNLSERNFSTQCKAIALTVMSDSWIKIQEYSASAWQMQKNFIIPELEESQLSLKVISFQSCPSKDTVLLSCICPHCPWWVAQDYQSQKIARRLLFPVCWAPALHTGMT